MPIPEDRFLHSRCENLKSYKCYYKVVNDRPCSHDDMSKLRYAELRLKCDEGVIHCCLGNCTDLVSY
jgi:hypothetical protein